MEGDEPQHLNVSTGAKPPRARIRRMYVPNAVYFITCVTAGRRPLFHDHNNLHLLKATLRAAKEIHPFKMRAYVFLPDHFHFLVRVWETTDISKLLHSLKRNFTLNYKEARGINSRVQLWQKGFWDHVIRNDVDYVSHVNYIHYNPLKHGLVTKPADYGYSSFHEYVRRGWYDLEWGSVEPEEIKEMNFE